MASRGLSFLLTRELVHILAINIYYYYPTISHTALSPNTNILC